MKAVNTKKSGIVRFLYIKYEDRVVGVCLDFNILEEGKNFDEVRKHLETAAKLHLITVCKKKLSDDLLNRHAPKKYWELYEQLQSAKLAKKRKSIPASSYIDSYRGGKLVSMAVC